MGIKAIHPNTIASMADRTGMAARAAGSLATGKRGPALPCVSVRIAHTESAARTLPAAEAGELMVKGPRWHRRR